MDILVCYDVRTDSRDGRRRLRRIAKVCEDYGQRVQYSVFECTIDDTLFMLFLARCRKVVNVAEDSLRIYRLQGGRKASVTVVGRDGYVDFAAPLVV
jgi:CRISPR-associated protein Cas2